ncbi:MAG: helix-turn-helix domain-containing protein [Beijerinckiaceae bacterium]|nr:helix-turn-helix domain-containing protein [Beijerinckiaceae bacterium]MCZ8299464.1 helix-turn-helix domain-containing protein [Beijerinckiaceae bacterium]
MHNDLDQLRTFSEAIKILGVRPTWGHALVRAGRLRVVKLGRRTFVRSSELRRFIDSLDQETSPRADRAI